MGVSESRRRLVVLGVREYPADDPSYPASFDAQLEEFRAWWCDPRLGQMAFTPVTPQITTKSECLAVLDQEHLSTAGSEDVLVVYVTGHGARPSSGRHYLRMPDGDDRHPFRTHVRTADLVESLLNSESEHLLVLVNSCFGNALAEDVRRAMKDMDPARRQLDTVGVVTIGDFDDRPHQLELKELLAATRNRLTRVAGITTQHLTVDQFVQELASAAREKSLLSPTKVYPQRPTLNESLALPNPGYRPSDDVVEPSRRDVSATASELAYWLDRASGRTGSDDPGWYFSGRRALAERIAAFLCDQNGSLIVTGVAGSGKSALLARAVTLTDPKFLADERFASAVAAIEQTAPETIPPPRSVHAAVLARNQDSTGVLRAIASAIGAPLADGAPGSDENERLRRAIATAAATRPVTVVLDGLDEATSPARLVWEVLGPLANLTSRGHGPLVRFAVGVRSAGDATPGSLLALIDSVLPDTRVIRADESPQGDIAAYVAAILNHPGGPYKEDDHARHQVANVVAAHVSPSFLDARFAARALRARTTAQDVSDGSWLATLAKGTVGLLEEDLATLSDSRHALAVLRASAFAYGRGVPWAEVWPAMAEAVLGETIPEADELIARVLDGRLSGYLTQDVEDDRRVYRPVHEGLAADLRGNTVRPP